MNLAQLFTPPNQQGKYMKIDHASQADREEFPGCMKPIEFFTNDIKKNLLEWSTVSDNVILYRTPRYWYWFQLVDMDSTPIVEMIRFDNNGWRRWDSWANLHSVEDITKKWLLAPGQKEKYLPPSWNMKNCTTRKVW